MLDVHLYPNRDHLSTTTSFMNETMLPQEILFYRKRSMKSFKSDSEKFHQFLPSFPLSLSFVLVILFKGRLIVQMLKSRKKQRAGRISRCQCACLVQVCLPTSYSVTHNRSRNKHHSCHSVCIWIHFHMLQEEKLHSISFDFFFIGADGVWLLRQPCSWYQVTCL